jgi:hypothetical protein
VMGPTNEQRNTSCILLTSSNEHEEELYSR